MSNRGFKKGDIELDIGKRATLRADRLKKLNKEDKSYE
jgi:hypothetical protein